MSQPLILRKSELETRKNTFRSWLVIADHTDPAFAAVHPCSCGLQVAGHPSLLTFVLDRDWKLENKLPFSAAAKYKQKLNAEAMIACCFVGCIQVVASLDSSIAGFCLLLLLPMGWWGLGLGGFTFCYTATAYRPLKKKLQLNGQTNTTTGPLVRLMPQLATPRTIFKSDPSVRCQWEWSQSCVPRRQHILTPRCSLFGVVEFEVDLVWLHRAWCRPHFECWIRLASRCAQLWLHFH